MVKKVIPGRSALEIVIMFLNDYASLSPKNRNLVYNILHTTFTSLFTIYKNLLLEFKETVGLLTKPKKSIQQPKINQKNYVN